MHVSQATAGSKRAAGTLMDKTQTYIEYNGKTHTKDAIGGQSFAETCYSDALFKHANYK